MYSFLGEMQEKKKEHIRKYSSSTLRRGEQSRCLQLEVRLQVQ